MGAAFRLGWENPTAAQGRGREGRHARLEQAVVHAEVDDQPNQNPPTRAGRGPAEPTRPRGC